MLLQRKLIKVRGERKMKKQKLFSLLLIIIVFLSGCRKQNSIDDKTIIVGASVSPHAEILWQTKPYLESKGYQLQIVEFTEYIQPNVGVSDGSLDANFFQHQPYLDQYNEENKTDLVNVMKVHFEPLAIYQGLSKTLDIKDGATIGVPSDVTNEARALLLLDQLGLITVDRSKGLKATKLDIISNPKKIKIVEIEAAAIPSKLQDLDLGVINGNVALTANIMDKLIINSSEDPYGEIAKKYGNVLAVKKGYENKEAIRMLIEALHQPNIIQFINDKYSGAVIYLD